MSHVFATLPTPSTLQSEHLYLAQVRVGNTEVSDFGQPLLTSEWRNKGKRMERAEDWGAGPLQTGELPTPPHQVGALAISWISSTIGHVPCPCVYKPETGSSGEQSLFSRILREFLLCVRHYFLELGIHWQIRQNKVLSLREFSS